MYIAALVTVIKTWEHPKCPSIEGGVKKVWNAYTAEYYSAIRKDEMLPFVTTWMALENIVLNKISQTKS